ncbi:hypothetical protein H6A03_09460 [[Clostridium] spiroforme]|nr:hypothetical protein [Thomasclavelia spiroformis]MBM6880895.1 hypothetical protein [Thomasclavelia spiroformis]
MGNKEQVFLYIKDEIEKIASKEEQDILNEAKALEEEAYRQMQEEAKNDADHQLKKELATISSKASIEAASQLETRTKKLVEKRDGYVAEIFKEAREKIIEFVSGNQYKEYLLNHVQKIGEEYQMTGCVLYVRKEDMIYEAEMKKVYGLDIDVQIATSIQLGGFMIENPETHVVVDETLDFALESQKDWFYKTSGLMIK